MTHFATVCKLRCPVHALQSDRHVEFALSNGNLDLFKLLWSGKHDSEEVGLYDAHCLEILATMLTAGLPADARYLVGVS